jgi:MFS family permease
VMGIGCVAAAVSLAVLAAATNPVLYLVALSGCGFTMGLVYAFTTVATQTVVPPERAGEAAGVALTFLVTIAGVGVAVAGTALEVLQRDDLSTGDAISIVLGVIAAPLLVAGATVLYRARST